MDFLQIIDYCNQNVEACWYLSEHVIQVCLPMIDNIPTGLYQGYLSVAGGEPDNVILIAGSCKAG